MSLEEEDMTPCVGCGCPTDGGCCSPQCADLADERKAERARERRLLFAESLRVERAKQKAARAAQLANILGPKS